MPSRWQPVPQPVPLKACVYVIYLDGKLAYIGQTSDLCHRLAVHKGPKSPWRGKNFSMKVSFNRRYGEHAMRELRLIAKLNPPHNKVQRSGTFHKPWVPGDYERKWDQMWNDNELEAA